MGILDCVKGYSVFSGNCCNMIFVLCICFLMSASVRAQDPDETSLTSGQVIGDDHATLLQKTDKLTEEYDTLSAFLKVNREKLVSHLGELEAGNRTLSAEFERFQQRLSVIFKKVLVKFLKSPESREFFESMIADVEDIRHERDALNATLAEMKIRIGVLEKAEDICHIRYGDSCYWVELRDQVTCAEIHSTCHVRGGEPAVINSEKLYNMIEEHVRTLILPLSNDDHQNYIDSWLDWTYDRATGRLLNDDGTEATYVKWGQGYRDPTNCCCTAMKTTAQWTDIHQFVFNPPAGHVARGVLCMMHRPLGQAAHSHPGF